jgi:hypothetical protein
MGYSWGTHGVLTGSLRGTHGSARHTAGSERATTERSPAQPPARAKLAVVRSTPSTLQYSSSARGTAQTGRAESSASGTDSWRRARPSGTSSPARACRTCAAAPCAAPPEGSHAVRGTARWRCKCGAPHVGALCAAAPHVGAPCAALLIILSTARGSAGCAMPGLLRVPPLPTQPRAHAPTCRGPSNHGRRRTTASAAPSARRTPRRCRRCPPRCSGPRATSSAAPRASAAERRRTRPLGCALCGGDRRMAHSAPLTFGMSR